MTNYIFKNALQKGFEKYLPERSMSMAWIRIEMIKHVSSCFILSLALQKQWND